MRAVMISIRPEWCEKILNGEKTVEIRKTRPKLEAPFKVYIYCTKARKPIYYNGYPCCYEDDLAVLDTEYRGVSQKYGNPCGFLHETEDLLTSKVIAEFTCDTIITVDCDSHAPFNKETKQYIDKESCVDRETLWKYTNGFCAYGWHIADLKIYDQPKELSGFTGVKKRPREIELYQMEKAPQSWCYVSELEGGHETD